MPTLLFPGRHLLNTRFQETYLRRHLAAPAETLPLLGPRVCRGTIDEIIFAITSANQSHARYNPIPLESRAIAVDRFARAMRETLRVRCRIMPIPHYDPSPRFAEFLLKEIAEATEGRAVPRPENTIVLSSTPELVRQFIALGYGVLPAELESLDPPRYGAQTPIELLKRVVAAGESWSSDAALREALSPATVGVWLDYPDILRQVLRLYRDPLLTEQGSLTEMRNYSTYAMAMGHQAILNIKYADIKPAIVPGRIVDEGCADGALLVPIARDFPDSDLIGIEITGEFLARCLERQRALEYGGTYIHFHQRNITEPIFEPNSIHTTICNSTTHELWSYGKQEETLAAYFAEKFRQTRRGGRLVIRDVVGPEDGDREVLLWCNAADGGNANIHAMFNSPAALAAHVAGLSTAARFERFAADFLADQRERRNITGGLRYETLQRDGRRLFRLRLRDAMEFMMKKDYADNWRSELNEEFAFWSFSGWRRALTEAGFRVLEEAGGTGRGSRAYCSAWIVQNRFVGKVELIAADTGGHLDFPVTNMVLIGEK